MAKPNYSFQKRQKELSKKAKKEEKRLRKHDKNTPEAEDKVTIEDKEAFSEDE